MTTTPQSKVQIVTNPVALPGICVICRKSANGVTKFADCLASEEFYGAFYFCEDCCGELAEAFGFVHKLEVEATQEALENALVYNAELKEANVRLNRTLDNIISVRPSVRFGSDLPSNVDGTNSEQAVESVDSAESESDESNSKRRSKNVSQLKF